MAAGWVCASEGHMCLHATAQLNTAQQHTAQTETESTQTQGTAQHKNAYMAVVPPTCFTTVNSKPTAATRLLKAQSQCQLTGQQLLSVVWNHHPQPLQPHPTPP